VGSFSLPSALRRGHGTRPRRSRTRGDHGTDKPGGSSPRPGCNPAPFRTLTTGRTIPEGDFYHSLGLPQRSAGYPRSPSPTYGSTLKELATESRRWTETTWATGPPALPPSDTVHTEQRRKPRVTPSPAKRRPVNRTRVAAGEGWGEGEKGPPRSWRRLPACEANDRDEDDVVTTTAPTNLEVCRHGPWDRPLACRAKVTTGSLPKAVTSSIAIVRPTNLEVCRHGPAETRAISHTNPRPHNP